VPSSTGNQSFVINIAISFLLPRPFPSTPQTSSSFSPRSGQATPAAAIASTAAAADHVPELATNHLFENNFLNFTGSSHGQDGERTI
jgi:hypothetical protein